MIKFKRILSLLWAIRPGGTMQERGAKLLQSHGINIIIKGTIPEYQCIMVANHLGYLDAIALASIIKCRPIARSSLADWPGIGQALQRLGLVFYNRGNIISGFKTLRKSISILRNGENILVFPEGTTTDGRIVLPFKRGIFGVSKLTGVPIVPIHVRFLDKESCWWDTQSFGKHYWHQIGKKTTTIEITILDPLYPGKHLDSNAFAQLARSVIVNKNSRKKNSAIET